MPRFFTGQVRGDLAEINGEDARHIALSLRMKEGERITVCDARGTDYQCVIQRVQPELISLAVTESAPSAGEPSVDITLYQAMPKGDKLEYIIQKAVELGVGRIVPVLSRRCVSRPDEKSIAKKLVRYNKIALEAAKQCGRGRVPQVEPMLDFGAAVERIAKAPLGIIFYENAEISLRETLSKKLQNEVSILIGSEGGFESGEVRAATERGLLPLSLGSRILRCETAPLAAVTAILYQAGDI